MLGTGKIREEVQSLTSDTRKWHSKREYRDLDQEQFAEIMQSKYSYLYTNSKTLFERCMQGDLNIQQFEYMLKMIERVNTGADYHTTSVEVGQKLVDVYVKPLIDKKE
jgi:hypothetical protein